MLSIIKKSKIVGLALTIILAVSIQAYSQAPSSLGDRFAIIIGGLGGQETYTEKYYGQTSEMYRWLVDSLNYDAANITYLFADPSLDSLRIDDIATADNVRKAFGRLSQQMKQEDQLYVFLVGHGTHDGDWSKFNLVGPDLKDLDFDELLSKLPSQNIVFVTTASASGPFIQRLSKGGRIIITATKSGSQIYETSFAEFFLEAVTSREADFNKDKRVSMSEAFTFARTKQDKWFEEERRVRAEHPLLDDNGDGEGSQDLEEGGDGQSARRVYLDPVSRQLRKSLSNLQSGEQSPKDKLLVQKVALEQKIENLKANKAEMDAQTYSKQLESLLIELARTNQQIKALEGQNQ